MNPREIGTAVLAAACGAAVGATGLIAFPHRPTRPPAPTPATPRRELTPAEREMVDAVMRDALAQTWLAIDATTDDPAERDRLRKAAREAIPPVRDVFEDLVLNPPDDPPGTPLLDVIERRKREMKR